MALIQSLVDSSKYGVKCPYTMSPIGICVHNTANDAPAKNEVSYMKSNNNEVSFHIAVDDVEAIQCIPFNRNAWAAGDGGSGTGNRKYIHVEICYSKSGGPKFVDAENRAAKEIAALLKQFGWTISNVKKHQDFSGKYCPHRTLDTGWQRFLNMVQAELNSLNGSASKPSTSEMYRVRKSWSDAASQIGAYSNLDNAKALCDKNPGYSVFNSAGTKVYPVVVSNCDPVIKKYAESGKCTITTASGIKFRDKHCTHCGAVQGVYNKNESVYYDQVCITEKYTWISWIGGSGARRWMPITDRKSGERWATCV